MPHKRGKQRRAYYEKNRDRELQNARKLVLRKKYGMSVDDYDRMLVSQHGVCAICRRPEVIKNQTATHVKALAIDHNHTTGRIRELLCDSCNKAIGFLSEDPLRARAVADYLEKHGALDVGRLDHE